MTVFNGAVAVSADDALEKDDNTGFTSTGVTADLISSTTAGTRSNIGLHFSSVTIPNSATINTATLAVYLNNGSKNNAVLAHIYAEAADSAVDFSSNPDVTSRTTSTANVAWSATGLTPTGFINAPDIASVVQEIVNRAGWASGNGLAILLKGDNSATARTLRINTHDAATPRDATLTIDYTAAGGGGTATFETLMMMGV